MAVATGTRCTSNPATTPAWIAAVVAVLVAIGTFAVWAQSPSTKQIKDHETRLRTVENVLAAQLATITTELRLMRTQMTKITEDLKEARDRSAP